MKELGIKKTVLLTGDNEETAKRVALELGVDEYYANLLPEDKVTLLERYLSDNVPTVAFVGDGINDAPVLARTDVGIAMGGLGSDAAIEAADVVIMEDDISRDNRRN
ncbi:MAG: HAD-IC family P-type ATPase [Defluviitoga tunisiensis]